MPAPAMVRGLRASAPPTLTIDPTQYYQMWGGVQVPDPITFVVGEQWCNRSNLYPRQATLIKVVFLREDLFTPFDYEVLEEWQEQYRNSNGMEGLAPGTLKKMRFLRALGHRWFREVLLVMGRRAGKGHVTALCMAYVLWNYMAKGDPQKHYGVDRDKQLVALIFAGKRDQAKATVFGDLVNVITGGPCFAPYINSNHTEKLSVYAPHDFVKMKNQAARGLKTERDQATFVIQPRESTVMAGRGPTSFTQCLDPETPVLTADLDWVPIRDLRVGDEVMGIDEQGEHGKKRRLRSAIVEAVWHTRKRALRFTFEDGSSVVCSPDHRWLSAVEGGGGNYLWRTSEKIRPGHRIRRLVDPWEPDESWGAGYLAGFFDGEGCIVSTGQGRRGSDVLWSQNPGPVLDQVNDLLRDRGFTPRLNRDPDSSRCQQWALRGMGDVLRFLGQVKPTRLFAKARFTWEGLVPSDGKMKTDRFKTVVTVEELPVQDLVDITTTTRTFIASGLVSHNCYDEAAHIVASGANRSAQEVYDAAKPSLDQFGKDAFICHPSSPWQMLGMFYDNWQRANERDIEGEFVYPDMLSIQLASWDIYKDWEFTIPGDMLLFPTDFTGDLDEYVEFEPPRFAPLRGAIQVYDDQMAREERANPDTFKVERRAKWATALDAYLNEEKVKGIWMPWQERPARYGPPELFTQTQGILTHTYKGHADPSKVNDKFGVAIAHVEYDEEGKPHCVFDRLHHFDPIDFPDRIVDYEEVDEWLWSNMIKAFVPEEFTFDQYNSTSSIQRLQKRVRMDSLPKRVQIFEKTTTRAYDWEVKENAKSAINLGLVHAPYDSPASERADLELRYLQLVNGRVDHPSAGEVQSKDIADAMMECIHVLIGEQVNNFLHSELSAFRPGATLQGGVTPFSEMYPQGSGMNANDERLAALSSFGKARGRQEYTPSRNLRSRHRRP